MRRILRAYKRLRRRTLFRLRGIEAINELLLNSTWPSEILRQFGAEVGRGVIHGPLIVHNAAGSYGNLKIGGNVHLGRNVFLDLTDELEVAEEATVSMGTTILTHQDIGNRPLAERYPRKVAATRIGRGAYVGADVTILCGCHVGELAVVGAGAVVIRPVPPGAVVVGIPARVI